MKIGYDLDGVLSRTYEEFFNYHNRVHGTSWKISDAKEYDLVKVMKGPQNEDIDKDSFWKRFGNFLNTSGPYIMPYQNAIGICERLHHKGHELYLITARQRVDGVNAAKVWYDNNLQHSFNGLFFNKNKGHLCNELGISVMVEDSIDNIQDCALHGVYGILMDRPYNKDLNTKLRIKNHNEIPDTISMLEKVLDK